MPPKITGKAILERWRTFIAEHKTTPVESGGAGHALAVFTRQKLAAGHLSTSEIAELNRLKREASRASRTNSGDAHPAVVPGVGAEHGAAGDSGVEQPAAGEHAVAQSAKASAGSSDSSGVKQPAARSKNEEGAQPRKRLCLGAQAPTSPAIAAAPSSGSSIAQPAPFSCSAEGGVNKPAAIESSSSGVAQSAAAKQCPSRAGCVLNTESNGIVQPAASCQKLRSTMVFMKILEPVWASEVADGQKMFECVANKTKWQNQVKQLSSGDLFIVVMKGRDKVNAVCEVASPAIVKETNRDVLKSKLQESRHEALEAYLDDAASFDYVEFKQVFDCRSVFSEFNTAASLELVGLALPRTPLVGLLRPDVIDAQWHNRLYECMQQATPRMPVSLGT